MEVLFDIQPEPLERIVVGVHRGGRHRGRGDDAAAGVTLTTGGARQGEDREERQFRPN